MSNLWQAGKTALSPNARFLSIQPRYLARIGIFVDIDIIAFSKGLYVGNTCLHRSRSNHFGTSAIGRLLEDQ